MTMPRDVEEYAQKYRADYGFESIAVGYRHRLLIERLHWVRPEVVVEIGCGGELLYGAWLKESTPAQTWIIVEPAEQFAAAARSSELPNLVVIQSFLEKSVDRLLRVLPKQPDMIICSSLLHEVQSSEELIAAARALMGPETLLHVNVPNSESLHRRLAQAMGLIPGTKAMSDRNRTLMQHRVYDMSTLKSELTACGLRVVEEGGYLVKPCTHRQMERVAVELGADVLDGLFELGKQMPESASEIWVEVKRGGRGW